MRCKVVRAGIEELRNVVDTFNECNETFNCRFSAEQLITLWRAWRAGEWLIYPDRWTRMQVWGALRGIPPMFRETDESPVAYDFGGWR